MELLLRKQLMVESCELFLNEIFPPYIFNWVLNTPLKVIVRLRKFDHLKLFYQWHCHLEICYLFELKPLRR